MSFGTLATKSLCSWYIAASSVIGNHARARFEVCLYSSTLMAADLMKGKGFLVFVGFPECITWRTPKKRNWRNYGSRGLTGRKFNRFRLDKSASLHLSPLFEVHCALTSYGTEQMSDLILHTWIYSQSVEHSTISAGNPQRREMIKMATYFAETHFMVKTALKEMERNTLSSWFTWYDQNVFALTQSPQWFRVEFR